MVWVKAELAEELAVVAAWLSALVPWSVSVALGSIGGATLVEVRFPFVLVRYLFGLQLEGSDRVQNPLLETPFGAAEYYAESPGAFPYEIWIVAAGILLLAVVLSLLLYFFEAELAESSVDPVRLMGALILLAAILLTVSSAVLELGLDSFAQTDSYPGTVIPIGVLLQYAFAYVLLRVERVDEQGATADPDASDPA